VPRHDGEADLGSPRQQACARAHGLEPIVLFLPQKKGDLSSPARWIAALRDDHPDALFLDLADAPLDWDRYNLNRTVCQPSPYGYDQIAPRHRSSSTVSWIGPCRRPPRPATDLSPSTRSGAEDG
jgi:hypothetical protein